MDRLFYHFSFPQGECYFYFTGFAAAHQKNKPHAWFHLSPLCFNPTFYKHALEKDNQTQNRYLTYQKQINKQTKEKQTHEALWLEIQLPPCFFGFDSI